MCTVTISPDCACAMKRSLSDSTPDSPSWALHERSWPQVPVIRTLPSKPLGGAVRKLPLNEHVEDRGFLP